MTQDFNKAMQDMMSAFPMDTSAMQDAFRTQAQLAERLSRVALDAAEQSTEISSGWTKETLSRLRDATAVKDEPAEYSQALTQLASAQAETTSETMARFAEVAKRVQMNTVELMLSAGKELAEDTAQQSRAAAERGQRATQDMAARGQEFAGKTQDAVTRISEQNRDAMAKVSQQGREAASATAQRSADATKATAQKSADASKTSAQKTSEAAKANAQKTSDATKADAQKSADAAKTTAQKSADATKATAGAK